MNLLAADNRKQISLTITLLHQWQAQELTWADVQQIAGLDDEIMLALDPVERTDHEPELIQKVLDAFRKTPKTTPQPHRDTILLYPK